MPGPIVLLVGPFRLAQADTPRLAAVLVFTGVLVTASVTLIGILLTRQANLRLAQENERAHNRLVQEHEDEERRLRLDAAMRAGALFSPSGENAADPAAIASGLLALTRLDQADLAVALLVDLWDNGKGRVSIETAVLVIDAALRSQTKPNAQLVAAELLCRNAPRLDSCQSLHWPSVIDGCWDSSFGPKTKLLLLDALVTMILSDHAHEHSVRSAAVRLYGIWNGDPDVRVRGCVGTLIAALIPTLCELGYVDFMQGNQRVMLAELEAAAGSATANPDGFLDRIVADHRKKLEAWAQGCGEVRLDPGRLATDASAIT
ncbi:hypothetical protein [Lentzea atacamensis]|uniref:hypothetical protein n=1 Tax=Lentzea atacamensis TaxID=531938 RepID=UPI0011B3B51B|nr:hypothetical protein [Lentzea atacamensis]